MQHCGERSWPATGSWRMMGFGALGRWAAIGWILAVCAGAAVGFGPRAFAERPNIVVVLADDLGIGDTTATHSGCRIATPHLQRLAGEGLTFLDAHTPSSVCTPTRYGLLTGRYNWRSRLAQGVLNGFSPPLIPPDRPTIAHLLRRAGYKTAMVGKWHLGWNWSRTPDGKVDYRGPVTGGPDACGFDWYYALPASLDMPPYVWVESGRVTAVPDREAGVTPKEDRYAWYRKGPIAPDFQIENALPHLVDQAIGFIRKQATSADRQPFFLYLALPAPHTPIVPSAEFRGKSGLNPYGDYVMQVDAEVGRILKTLEDSGISETTLFIFTSDNGCSPVANYPLLRSKGHDPSAGYRGYKADLFEGGHRVPLIVRWPGHIVRPGRTTSALVCLTDLYATFREIVGAKVEDRGGEDSVSFLPALAGKDATGRTTLVSHSISGRFAIRQGPWKLLLAYGSGGWSKPRDGQAKRQGLPPVQLYRLDQDRGERQNRVQDHPERASALWARLRQEVERGRSTPGKPQSNDRPVDVLPPGVTAEALRSLIGK